MPDPLAVRAHSLIDAMAAENGELSHLVDVLKGALAAAGLPEAPEPAEWMADLGRQERALVGALYAKHPRPISRETLLSLLPGQDRARERAAKTTSVIVRHVRQKIGDAAIINERGLGYRLGDAFHASIQATSTGEAP